jgi:hypothetical protein
MDRKARFRELFDLVGYPRDEVARLLGCSALTVKSYLASRGLVPTVTAVTKMEVILLYALRTRARRAGYELVRRRNSAAEQEINIFDNAA